MANAVCKEPPVLNLVINVINIAAPATGSLSLVTPGLVQTTTPLGGSMKLEVDSVGELCSEPESPLGYVVLRSGNLVPFGVKPTAVEASTFGDRKYWKEIRVCLPPCLLAENETDNYCPVASCRERLPRNKSMDYHIKKHLGTQAPMDSDNLSLPCPLAYYCVDKQCQYFVESAEKSFKAFKNMKQHYLKVHAPRVFDCDQCQKTFATLKVLDAHKLICGETFSCSSCKASYNTLESLQTHCRRKQHTYDYTKYKDKRNSVKLEMLNKVLNNLPPLSSPGPGSSCSTALRKGKTSRKFPMILPKGSVSETPKDVLSSIQELCHRAGVKVDLGCQTVCTAFLQNSRTIEPPTSQPVAIFAQKKRKSTDTQTNIVKFRATCQDQKHNATNTVRDWKKVVTSDSETQTAETSTPEVSQDSDSTTTQVNDEFSTFKISEKAETEISMPVQAISPMEPTIKQETAPSSSIKVSNGPNLNPEFISFLEAIDSATQTDPEMFDDLNLSECFGIRALFGEDQSSGEENLTAYVSVSSTASQTLVESVRANSLSAEDYEALLKNSDEKDPESLFTELMKSEGLESLNLNNNHPPAHQEPLPVNGSSSANEFLFDWENIIEEVYRDGGSR